METRPCQSFFIHRIFFAVCIMTVAIMLVPPVRAYDPQASDYRPALDPALGIGKAFGRWNTQINLVYDPDDAPALFADDDVVIDLLEEAVAEWVQVSGIQMTVVGVDRNIQDDDDLRPDDQDNLVRVFWGNTGGAAGQAGPKGDFYNEDLGYYPYIDGIVKLSSNSEHWESTFELLPVLVHELGHLIGLGHSDNPASVMYANPYNFLNHPRADDILAARALYGKGSLSIADVTQPISQWLYSAPPAASASATAKLFKSNGIFDQGAFIALDSDTPVSEVNAQTEDGNFLWFYYAMGPSSSKIEIDATFVLVDPFGYQYEGRDQQISCEPNFSCGVGTTITKTHVIKSVPGEWTVYMVDDDTNTTLLEYRFTVNTTTSYNKPPQADVTVTGVSNTMISVSLDVTDAEDDAIQVVWHQHGDFISKRGGGNIDNGSDGDTISRNISFLSAGTHTLFVELLDDSTRYDGSATGASSAGDGFRSLIAITVNLPVNSGSDADIRQSYLVAGSSPPLNTGGGGEEPKTGAVLINAIAETNALELVTASNGSATTAQFAAGASADGGVSTATTFSAGEEVVIGGSVSPQLGDIGFGGEVFVVMFSGSDRFYRDLDGTFVPITGGLKSALDAAYLRSDLKLTENVEIFSGTMQPGLYRFFLGYRVTEGSGGPIHFNARAFRVTVE